MSRLESTFSLLPVKDSSHLILFQVFVFTFSVFSRSALKCRARGVKSTYTVRIYHYKVKITVRFFQTGASYYDPAQFKQLGILDSCDIQRTYTFPIM